MKLGFPSYETTFPCDCTLPEATERIAKAAALPVNKLKIEKAYYSAGTQNIVLQAGFLRMVLNDELKWTPIDYYSFSPIPALRLKLELKETDQGTVVSTSFTLRKYIKSFFLVYCIFAAFFEWILLVAFFEHALISNWILLIPLGMVAFAVIGIWINLRFVVRRILEILR